LDDALSEGRASIRRKRLVTGVLATDTEVVVTDGKYCHGTHASFAILHIFEAASDFRNQRIVDNDVAIKPTVEGWMKLRAEAAACNIYSEASGEKDTVESSAAFARCLPLLRISNNQVRTELSVTIEKRTFELSQKADNST
jgi:hypothetical protein